LPLMNMDNVELPVTVIKGSGRVTVPGLGEVKASGHAEIGPDRVHTSGSCVLPGGIKVQDLDTSGSLTIEGDAEADTMAFSGSTRVRGGLKFTRLSKSGSLQVEGDAEGETMEVSGSTTVEGKVKVRDLYSSGSISAEKGVESDGHVKVRGCIRAGSVKAARFELILSNSVSRVRGGLEADYIRVEPKGWGDEGELVTDWVKGGEVHLENVECDTVSGDNVCIGDGCRVNGKVTYTRDVRVSPYAFLREQPQKA
jgi:cytoskeletal protein CcmA (bactofilin family)